VSEDLGGAFDVLLDVVLPVFAVAGVGFWYAGRSPFPRREIAEFVLRLTGACLVFDALSQGERLATDGLLAIAGVVADQLALPIPAVVAVPVRMLGETVVPMMLLSLGASLRMLLPADAAARSRRDRGGSVAARLALPTALAMLRLGGGWLVGQGVVALFGTAGTLVGDITVLVSALPPAVLNVVVADRYDRDPALVAAVIAIGTAAALITTPLVL